MSCRVDIEKKIKDIAGEIHSAMGPEAPSLFNLKSWQGEIMDWAMKDEEFKVNLFRFIDLLPSIRDDSLVSRILNEYFGSQGSAPMLLRKSMKLISGGRLLPHLAAKLAHVSVKAFAKQFIAGEDIDAAAASVNNLRQKGFAFSVDMLGEKVLSFQEEKKYATKYIDFMRRLGPIVQNWDEMPIPDRDERGRIPRMDLSIKISSIYSQLDPVYWNASVGNAKKAIGPIVDLARKYDASITFDMEHYYLKQLTIEIFRQVLDSHENFHAGIALQAYLKETKQDLLYLIDWAKSRKRRISIRLVKGAYWDYETVINRQEGWPVPVFLCKYETDRSFEELTGILFENYEFVRPAIATHNIRSIAHAIAVAESLNLPRQSLEFQMIYGMAEPIRNALKAMDYRVRVYAPIGELIPGMAYLVRRLLENTVNESFLRKSFFEKEPLEKLIQAPLPERESCAENEEVNVFRNEPFLDFSLAENRDKMTEAFQKVRRQFNKKYSLLIGGKEILTEKETLSVNPAKPSEVVGRISSAGRAEAEQAIAEARKALSEWKKKLPSERAAYLFRAADEMKKKRFELAALEVLEVGKGWKEADADIAEAIDYLIYNGNEMIRLGEHRRLGDYPGEVNEYLYEPKGIGVVISPWNFPLAIPTGMASASIVAGNAAILKPSGLSPVMAWKLVEIFRSAGLPSGVLQFLTGSGTEVGEYLVSHPAIDFIAFTGSKEVGLKIVRLAGDTHPGQRNVKRVIAEMGGKNAIIVDETADLDEAVKGVLESAFGYQGQKCSACSRAIVANNLFDEFCSRLRDAIESIKIGPPEDPQNFMGPVVNEAALNKSKEYIEIGKREGKQLLTRKAEGEGYYVGPAVFTDIHPSARLAQEEIFGPVLSVIRADNVDEAIQIANGVQYALTGGIFSRSPANIEKAKREFMVGNLYINRKITGALVGRQPFGGFGMSGVGSKAGGPDYLLQFMNPRSICENTLRKGFAPK